MPMPAGEQQPESDHFIEAENSASGTNGDRHWRNAKGWFSYKLNDKDTKADRLQVTYFGRDKDRKFKILVNDQLIHNVELDGSMGDNFFTANYLLPASLVQAVEECATLYEMGRNLIINVYQCNLH